MLKGEKTHTHTHTQRNANCTKSGPVVSSLHWQTTLAKTHVKERKLMK